jgi:hypothetical protein
MALNDGKQLAGNLITRALNKVARKIDSIMATETGKPCGFLLIISTGDGECHYVSSDMNKAKISGLMIQLVSHWKKHGIFDQKPPGRQLLHGRVVGKGDAGQALLSSIKEDDTNGTD